MKTLQVIIPEILIFILSVSCSRNRTAVTTEELRDHIKYLSSDSLKGRLTGTPGDSLAAEYIKARLLAYGLAPVSGDGFQRFRVTDKVVADSTNALSVNGKKFIHGQDFEPSSFSENGSLSAGVIFAGYGFNINNDSLKWDDYKGKDIKGCWVLILRGDPDPDNNLSKYALFGADRDKALIAKDLGAAGIFMVSGANIDKEEKFDPLSKNEFSVGIPVIRIKRSVADAILLKSKNNIADLEKRLNTSKKPFSFITRSTVDARSHLIQYKTNTRNVVMILPGTDSVLKKEYVIVGAHFDHLGMGGPGSSSRAVDTIGVHHGADDNASGVAMIIELAGKFAGTRNSHKRSLIFCAFTGEELGLLGSKYFTDNPLVNLSKADAMVNLDMVGRLKDTKDLQVGGVGTAEGLKEMALALDDTALLKVETTDEGSGPSDHSSFYAKNIPVLFITTGAHADYHTPSDTWEKINYNGMVTVSDLVYGMTYRLANDTARLKFREAGPKTTVTRDYRKKGVKLGIMPDFAGAVKNGLRADLVTPGKPAAIGGMKKGDIIVAINGKPVNNIEDYMFRMGQLKHGERITVDVLRNNKKEVLIIQL
jgi:aminopeptidase YwaD